MEAQANLGLIVSAQARYEEAASGFRKAITLKPSLWSVQADLGLSQARPGRVREAVSLLDVTLPRLQDPILRARVGLELIQMHYEAKEFAKALDASEVIRRASPDIPDHRST